MAQPWERQENESDVAFEAFKTYRDMGAERSLASVGKKLGKSQTLMERWSSNYSWVDRARSWDDEQDRILRNEQIKDIKRMRQRHADLAVEMLAKALEGLKRLDPEELNAVSIGRLVEVASKLEQKSRGDTTDAIEMREAEEKQPGAVKFYLPDNHRTDEVVEYTEKPEN